MQDPLQGHVKDFPIFLSRNPRKKFGVQERVPDRSRVPLRVSISEMCGNRYNGNCDGSFTSSRTGNRTGCFMGTPTKINMRKTYCLYRNLCVFSCTAICVKNFSFKTFWNFFSSSCLNLVTILQDLMGSCNLLNEIFFNS